MIIVLVAIPMLALLPLFDGGRAYWPFVFAGAFALGIVPGVSAAIFPSVAYGSLAVLDVVLTLALVVPLILLKRTRVSFDVTESKFTFNRKTLVLLTVLLAAVLITTLHMLRTLHDQASSGSLYALNVAYAQNEQTFGLWGRISRLAIPAGLACFLAGIYAKNSKERRVYILFAVLFAATLLSVRRSAFFYEVAFYVLAYLTTIQNGRRLFKVMAVGAGATCAALLLFGYVQVQTHKSQYESAWASGIHDGSSYVTGNLPYAECLNVGGTKLPSGTSFPDASAILSKLNGTSGHAGDKPFCRLPDGQLFNTSPAYFDVNSDFGPLGVVSYGALIGVALGLLLRRSRRYVGLEVMLCGVVLFSFRENLLGSLDIVQSLLVYPVLVALIFRPIRNVSGRIHSERVAATSILRGER